MDTFVYLLLLLSSLTLFLYVRSSYEHPHNRYILLESNQTPTHKHKNDILIMKYLKRVLACFAGFLPGLLAGYITNFFLNNNTFREPQLGPTIFCQSITLNDLAFLEQDDIVATLTVLGRGGCGEVYKADILNGRIESIAIKKVIQPLSEPGEPNENQRNNFKEQMRQIQAETQIVGKIRHRNIVRLLAYVPRPTCHYLVYEFMSNGSLDDILKQVENGTRQLYWLDRYKIAIGVASALDYLHTSVTPRVVHRDIKPANVLLDSDMEPRITDFGLAKQIAEADSHVTLSAVGGSRGFIAPEYSSTGIYTEKCDIYSFGVLLAVLVNGKLPTDKFFSDTVGMDMMVWIRKMMSSDDQIDVIHSSLLGHEDKQKMLNVIEIACLCTSLDSNIRPTSKECVDLLNKSQQSNSQ